MSREPRVIVGLRKYDGELGDIDVEVFADNPEGRDLSEMFLKADAGIADVRLVENNPVSLSNSLSQAYPIGTLEEVQGELVENGTVDAEVELRWLIDNVDAQEAMRILLTARQVLHQLPGHFTAAEALQIAVIYERG